MGTNYYLYDDTDRCQYCGRGSTERHIGKSSAGWTFSLHVSPEDGIYSLEDWQREWSKPNTHIENEYHDTVSAERMMEIITRRDYSHNPVKDFDWHGNSAEPGPLGLVRHRIDGRHCIGHGPGTWDLIVGTFQ